MARPKQPDCCCGDSCIICADKFDRGDSTSTGAWNEMTGNWEIKSSQLWINTINAKTICIGGVNNTIKDVATRVDVTVKTFNDIARVLALVDTSGPGAGAHYFAELVFQGSNSTVSIGKFNGTTNTIFKSVKTNLIVGTTYNVTLCVRANGVITVKVKNGNVQVTSVIYIDSSVIIAGSGGVGTGAVVGSLGIYFDNFIYYKLIVDNCPSCSGVFTSACKPINCKEGTIPTHFLLEFKNLQNNFCDKCQTIGIYTPHILELKTNPGLSGFNCKWQGVSHPSGNDAGNLGTPTRSCWEVGGFALTIGGLSGGAFGPIRPQDLFIYLAVGIATASGINYGLDFMIVYPDQSFVLDCLTINNLELPFHAYNDGGLIHDSCNWEHSRPHITAL